MPNQTQIECFFKSADLIALCGQSPDVVINIVTTFNHGQEPSFAITAAPFDSTNAIAMDGTTNGCPTPCR